MGSKSRTEAFSDGIFAIAATLLVLDLAVPRPEPTLLDGFLHEWPAYAAYATSFLTIGIIWVNHHAVLERLERIDREFLFLNVIFLLFVALIPFPTRVLAQYLQSGGSAAHIAAVRLWGRDDSHGPDLQPPELLFGRSRAGSSSSAAHA